MLLKRSFENVSTGRASARVSFLGFQVASLRLPLHRNVPDGDGRSRPRRLRRSQHHRVRASRQRPDLQPHVRPPHHCRYPSRVSHLSVEPAHLTPGTHRAFQGDRFGGALDAAAKQFSKAFDSGMPPMEFVNKMKKDGKLIMGIGHRVKSVSALDLFNPKKAQLKMRSQQSANGA